MKAQRLNKEVQNRFDVAHKYYQILSVLNDMRLSEGEVQLMAYTAIRGNITEKKFRKEYCIFYDTTIATINNVVHRLKKRKLLLKDNGIIFINPSINTLDYSEGISLIVNLTLEQPEEKINLLNVNKYG